MKNYLNLGCGKAFSTGPEWTNIDFVSGGKGVIAHNLLKGIPFPDQSFDLVYHSHILEHFAKDDGELFIAECFRVLRPGGLIRIAVPDLEAIVRNYTRLLDQLTNNPDDETAKANYEWIMLELYDQAVRNYGGGKMAQYLFQPQMKNEDFVFERMGEEGRQLRKLFTEPNASTEPAQDHKSVRPVARKLKDALKAFLLNKLNINKEAAAIGHFRVGGEIHQWMYDRYSLKELLARKGGKNIKQRDAFTSSADNWAFYRLDVVESGIRKPDSLFMEANK